MTSESYLDRAVKFGQNLDRLKNGEPVQTLLQINTLEEFRYLFA